MSINSISNNSQAYTVVDDVLRHKDKLSHAHKPLTGAPIPFENKEEVKPTKEGLGKYIDITI